MFVKLKTRTSGRDETVMERIINTSHIIQITHSAEMGLWRLDLLGDTIFLDDKKEWKKITTIIKVDFSK